MSETYYVQTERTFGEFTETYHVVYDPSGHYVMSFGWRTEADSVAKALNEAYKTGFKEGAESRE